MRVTVIQHPDGSFDLLTERGHRVGPRLLAVSPKKGEQWPTIREKIDGKMGAYADRDAAYAASLAMNLYLQYAAKHRSKSRDRGKE